MKRALEPPPPKRWYEHYPEEEKDVIDAVCAHLELSAGEPFEHDDGNAFRLELLPKTVLTGADVQALMATGAHDFAFDKGGLTFYFMEVGEAEFRAKEARVRLGEFSKHRGVLVEHTFVAAPLILERLATLTRHMANALPLKDCREIMPLVDKFGVVGTCEYCLATQLAHLMTLVGPNIQITMQQEGVRVTVYI